MKIRIDEQSGFCFGVVNAINKAEKMLADHPGSYSLGDIVHNRIEVNRLENMGLCTIKHEQLNDLRGATVLIRAHGEPPSTYKKAEAMGINIVDATCPVVAHLQRTVVEAWKKMQANNGQVVILGKKGHAEVVGLIGQVDSDAIVIETVEDLDQIDFSRPIYFLSQTTKSLSLFEQCKEEIYRRAKTQDITIHDTICRQVSNRNPHLREFSTKFDVVIFVSGQKSSNGLALYQVCKASNERTHKIEDQSELQDEWFRGANSVGICGATSTPKWLMEQIANYIEQQWGNS